MKSNFKKIISLLLIVGMNWSAISLIAGTDAYFNDTEISKNNIMETGILNFELASSVDFAPEINLGLDSTKTISVADTASTMNYNYTVSVDPTSLSGNLCEYLYLEDNTSGAPQQSLTDFVPIEVSYPYTPILTFTASLNSPTDSNWENQVCNFDLVYDGRQEDCDGGGFSDVERINNTIVAGEAVEQLLITVDNVTVSPLQSEHCGNCQGSNNNYCAPGLYYSQQLTIDWTATTTNTSGDSELSIDIVYITDNDCSGDISDGDISYTITSGTDNNGSYVWDGWTNNWNGNSFWEDENGNTVPYFYGLTWIKITATSSDPENSMVSDSDTSIAMFEPMPPGVSAEQMQSILENSSSCDGCCSKSLDNYFEANNPVDGSEEDTGENEDVVAGDDDAAEDTADDTESDTASDDDIENEDDEEAKPEVSNNEEDDDDADNTKEEDNDDMENEDNEEAKPETEDEEDDDADADNTKEDDDTDDMKEEDNDTDTDADDIEEDEEAKPETDDTDDTDDTEDTDDGDANSQDDGDGLNKNMVDSVQAPV